LTIRSVFSVVAAGLGVLLPLILLRFGAMESLLVFLLWPSSIALRVPHIWPSEHSAATFFGVVLIFNGILYAAVGFFAARKMTKVVSRPASVSTLITVCTVLLLVIGTAVLGRPILYRFAPGYQGVAIVEYANPSCSPLTSRGISQIVHFPENGRVCTSSPKPLEDTFRYVMYTYTVDGAQRLLSRCDRHSSEVCVGRIVQSKQDSEYPTRAIFIGTQQEFFRVYSGKSNIAEPVRIRVPPSDLELGLAVLGR